MTELGRVNVIRTVCKRGAVVKHWPAFPGSDVPANKSTEEGK